MGAWESAVVHPKRIATLGFALRLIKSHGDCVAGVRMESERVVNIA